jgi:diguanylate cyclase (GGDEF)-like protein
MSRGSRAAIGAGAGEATVTGETPDGMRDELLAILAEDAHNTERLCRRLDSLKRETGLGVHAAVLLILTRKRFPDAEAELHWAAIVERQREMSGTLAREVGVRVATMDYFVNVNRQLAQPTLIEMELLESESASTLDPVTGLVAERTFRTALANELRRSRRYELAASVVLFDLDDFAGINDRLGPLVADRVMREAAILLSNNVRDIDLAARCPSDELVLLLPETDRNGALLVADRCRRAIERYFGVDGPPRQAVGLTVSGGIASYPGDAHAPEDLLTSAACALYQAKAAGKNVIELNQPERRRYLRFDLEPGLFEVEILSSSGAAPNELINFSRDGLLFRSPEAIEVAERIELRLASDDPERPVLRGTVVRLEELHEGGGPGADRYDIGVVFDRQGIESRRDMLAFLERARASR